MNPSTLSFALAEAALLLAAHPDLAEDAELRADVIEGETSVHDVLARLVEAEADASDMDAALAKRIDAMKARRERYQDRKEAVRRMMRQLLDASALPSIRLPEATITAAQPTVSLDLADGFTAPQGYGRVKIEPDKTAIKRALQAGETMDGACLVTRPGTVSIRR